MRCLFISIYDGAFVIITRLTWISLFASLQIVAGVFNADELKILNYEVDISNSPIQANQEVDLPVLYMTSKFGQQYQCMLPQLVPIHEDPSASGKDAAETQVPDIQDLLKPLFKGPCLIKSKEWWTYELCIGQNIRQYHVEDSQIAGAVLNLGIYDTDYDWNSQTDNNGYVKLKHPRYHSQFYVNGSNCDLTGKPRTTEVRFFCEVDAGDYISRVDEPETCHYIMSVHTDRVCSHPYLKPAPSAKPHSIQCKPVLNEEHYVKYMQRAQEEQEKAEKKRQEWIGQQQKQLEELKSRLRKQMEGKKTDEDDEEDVNIKEAKVEDVNVESLNKDEDVQEEEDDDLVTEFEQSLDEMSVEDQMKILKDKSKLRDAISKEFDSIIEEAEDELQQELDEGSRASAYTKLASTLNRLISKLDKAEKDVEQATARFKKVHHYIDKLEASKQKLEKSMEEGEEDDENEEQGEEDMESESKLMPDFDNKVQVRIRKLGSEGKSGSESKTEDGKVHLFKEKVLDKAQKLQLEEAVRDKLEKAGLDANGRKIEVRIITAGFYNDEDGKSIHVLSDEESQQFQNMILSLLTGSQETRKEIERQRQMEKNYQFVWSDNKPVSDETEES